MPALCDGGAGLVFKLDTRVYEAAPDRHPGGTGRCVLAVGLESCATIEATIDATVGEALRAQRFPPPRTLFTTLSPEDTALHERAVVAALQARSLLETVRS
jgi:hypothetical protein